jgi:hypothetical protein
MEAIKQLNLILAFLLELCMFAIFAFWGYQQGTTKTLRDTIAIALMLFSIILWGIFAAPNSQYRLRYPLRMLFEAAMFLIASFLLYKSDHKFLAICFFTAVCLNNLIAYIYHQ